MGFFSEFGRGLGGLFGLSGVLGQSEVSKLQGQLATAKEKLNSVFQAGMVNAWKEQLKVDEQLKGLIEVSEKLNEEQLSYSDLVEKHDTHVNAIKVIISLGLLFVVIIYLMFLPKC